MPNHNRIETSDLASFLTTRSRNAALWFINNDKLEHAILAYTAKFARRYEVKLYALSIEGNHIQSPAHFPKANRAAFMRDWNSAVARAVPRYVPQYEGGRFWARRYSSEFLPAAEDIEEYFFYTVLQPIKDGLVEKISDYPGYNCFHDAVWGVERKFKFVRWADYNEARRFSKFVSIADYTEEVSLRYERIPGYEHLSQRDYALMMSEKLEQRRLKIVSERLSLGKRFLGKGELTQIKPGAKPINSKKSDRYSHRPRILSICSKRRAEYRDWYFRIYFAYKEASFRFRKGELGVEFPQGTYRPQSFYYAPAILE